MYHVNNPSISCSVDEEPSSSTAKDTEPLCSGSNQKYQITLPSSKRGSSQSLKGSRSEITTSDTDTRLFSLLAPPPREPGRRAKTHCSTLPSRHRGAEACYSLPRPSHSTSLTKFPHTAALTPLVPLGSSSSPSSSRVSSPNKLVSPSSPIESPSVNLEFPEPKSHTELFALKGPPAQPPRSLGKSRCSTLPPRQRASAPEEHSPKLSHSTSFPKLVDRRPPSPTELFVLKGPPHQKPRSRSKARCFTLPPRQRPTGPEEHYTKPSHSTSFMKLGDCIPPSPSELKRNTPV